MTSAGEKSIYHFFCQFPALSHYKLNLLSSYYLHDLANPSEVDIQKNRVLYSCDKLIWFSNPEYLDLSNCENLVFQISCNSFVFKDVIKILIVALRSIRHSTPHACIQLSACESASETKRIMTTFNIQVAEENLFQSFGVVVLCFFVNGSRLQRY
ncbi:hypothetical protein FF38_06253 [Lucilia cuprina]|uniref:Uncharacterized protein n=1 Tax=Lucilia cuprina TaxID=7375 RepID=A0A0L0C740_LUCCU|nr:hypothetical protein FF38_06253 [Lucilia cuprina]